MGRKDWRLRSMVLYRWTRSPTSREMMGLVWKLRLCLEKQVTLEFESRFSRNLPSGIRFSKWLLQFHREQTWRDLYPPHQVAGARGRTPPAPRELRLIGHHPCQSLCPLGVLASLDRKCCWPRGSQQGSVTHICTGTGVGLDGTEGLHCGGCRRAEGFIILKAGISLTTERYSLYFVIR